MPTPPTREPRPRAPEVRPAPKGVRHPVSSSETWVSLAGRLGIDAWDLIEFNFPGIKAIKQRNFALATLHVNWYLAEYVGCHASNDGGRNFAFSGGLSGRGRGDFRGGVIYLPPPRVAAPAVAPPAPSCTTIKIPPLAAALPLPIQVALAAAKVEWPTEARCLDPTEITTAQAVFGNSLDYGAIYVSNGIGAQGRPVTVAVPYGGSWIVVLNLGSHGHRHANSQPVALIHELAHAWQSQHHTDPWQFMVNCVKSQAAAEAATTLDAAVNSTPGKIVGSLVGLGPVTRGMKLGPADAYSYVPGKRFGDYGGEQIAQQVEDFFSPPRGRPLTGAERSQIGAIVAHVKSASAGARDPENERSLSTVRYVHKSAPGVVWHD